MGAELIPDDEIVYRRIPRAVPWFEAPETITSANFKLDRRRGDLGLSVYRASIVSSDEVLKKPAAAPNSIVASAIVGDIRALRNLHGEHLSLDVIVVNDENDPGHAEIRGTVPGKLSSPASKALRDLFADSVAGGSRSVR